MLPSGGQIVTYLTIGLAVFFVLFALIGLIVGMRKSIYRIITSVVYVAIIAIFAGTFTNAFFNADISSVVADMSLPDGVSGSTILEIVNSLAAQYAGEAAAADAAAFMLACISIVSRIVFIIVMVLVVYWVYWLITQIVWLIFFKKRAKKDENGEVKPVKKRRLIGAAIGGAKGIILYFLLVTVLITGPISLVPDFILTADLNSTENYSNESSPIDDEAMQEIKDFIIAYKGSAFYTIAGGGKEGSINSIVNDFVWKAKYGKYSFSLRKELANLISISGSVYELYNEFKDADEDNIQISDATYTNINKMMLGLANSQFITSLLPILTTVALNREEVSEYLPEGIDYSFIQDIDWAGDIRTLAQAVLDLKEVGDLTAFREEEVDLSKLNGPGIEQLMTTLSSVSFISNFLGVMVQYALSQDEVKEMIGDLEVELDDIIWKDEIKNMGKIFSAFLQVGLNSFDEIKGVEVIDELNLNGVKSFIKVLFASQLVREIFPEVMEKTVYQEVLDEDMRELFDFTAIDADGWENEFVTLINVVIEAKGSDSDPISIMTPDNQINFEIFQNLRTETLLNSTLLKDALIQTLLSAKEGKGFMADLQDSIVIPDSLSTKDAAGWISYVYKCVEAYGTYHVGDTISEAAYQALTDNKDKWERRASDGELYHFIEAAKNLIIESGIQDYSAMPSDETGYIDLLSSISSQTTLEIETSLVLNGTITKMITNLSEDSMSNILVIPNSALQTIDGIKVLSQESHELTNIIEGIKAFTSMNIDFNELDSFGLGDVGKLLEPYEVTEYVCTSAFDSYTVGSKISPEVYEGLSADQKDNFKVSEYAVYAYECNTAYGAYSKGQVISVEAYNALTSNKDKWTALYTRLDKILSSDILGASLSKIIVDFTSGEGDASVLVIPSTVEYSVSTTTGSSKLIEKGELRNLVQAIKDLDLDATATDLDIAALIETLVSEDPNNPGQLVIDSALNSEIIRCTISDKLLDMSEEEGSFLVIPVEVVQNLDATVKAIDASELKNLIVAVDTLDIDFSNLDSLDTIGLISTMEENVGSRTKIDVVLDSLTFQCTMSKAIIDQDNLVVPQDILDNSYATEKAILNIELKNLVHGVNASGIIQDGSIIDVNDASALSSLIASRVDLSASFILRATITTKVPEGTVNMPVDSYDATVDVGNANIKVLTEEELVDFLQAIELLDMTQLSDTSVGLGKLFSTLDSNTVSTDKKDIAYIMESRIIWDTVSDKLQNFDGLDLDQPDHPIAFLDGTKSAFDEEISDRYSQEEIIAILNAFHVIMGDASDDFSISTETLKTIYQGENRGLVAQSISESVVMTYNISSILKDAIEDVFPSADGYGFTSGAILGYLENVAECEWRDYTNTNLAYQVDAETGQKLYTNDGVNYYNSAELEKLLTVISEYQNFADNVMAVTAEDGRVFRQALIALNDSKVTAGVLPTYFSSAWSPVLSSGSIYVEFEGHAYNTFASLYQAVFNETYDSNDQYTAQEMARAALANVNVFRAATHQSALPSLDD